MDAAWQLAKGMCPSIPGKPQWPAYLDTANTNPSDPFGGPRYGLYGCMDSSEKGSLAYIETSQHVLATCLAQALYSFEGHGPAPRMMTRHAATWRNTSHKQVRELKSLRCGPIKAGTERGTRAYS